MYKYNSALIYWARATHLELGARQCPRGDAALDPEVVEVERGPPVTQQVAFRHARSVKHRTRVRHGTHDFG